MRYLAMLTLVVLAACGGSTAPKQDFNPNGSFSTTLGVQPWHGDSVPGDSLYYTVDISGWYQGTNDGQIFHPLNDAFVDSTKGCLPTSALNQACDSTESIPDSLHLSGHVSSYDPQADDSGHIHFTWVFGSEDSPGRAQHQRLFIRLYNGSFHTIDYEKQEVYPDSM